MIEGAAIRALIPRDARLAADHQPKPRLGRIDLVAD